MESIIFLGLGIALGYAGMHVVHSKRLEDFENITTTRLEAFRTMIRQRFTEIIATVDAKIDKKPGKK